MSIHGRTNIRALLSGHVQRTVLGYLVDFNALGDDSRALAIQEYYRTTGQ